MRKKVLIYLAKLWSRVNRTEGCQMGPSGSGGGWVGGGGADDGNTWCWNWSKRLTVQSFLSRNTVIFIASSFHEFVPVAFMQINLIYLNDSNGSYVYFWETHLWCNCEIKTNSLEELKRIFMCFWLVNEMIFNTGYFISTNYLKALIFLVLWLHFKYPLYALSMKQSDSLMCRNLVIQPHNSKKCLFNKGKLDHTLLVGLTKSSDHHFFLKCY